MSISVCKFADLTEGVGVAALLPDDRQVAIFRVNMEDGEQLFAVDNIDPYTGVAVISRGIVGEAEGRPTIASPLLKQKFFLDSGESLQDDSVALHTYAVRIDGSGDDSLVIVEA